MWDDLLEEKDYNGLKLSVIVEMRKDGDLRNIQEVKSVMPNA